MAMIVATSTPRTWKIGSELIKFWQKTEFSHVLIIKDDLVFQASHGYVNCTYLDTFLSENKIISKYVVEDEFVDFGFVKSQLGKKYSFWQLVMIPVCKWLKVKWSGNGDSSFICSEYVGKALRLDWVTDLTTPKEIDDYLKSL
jgi:hypothetical protein